MLIDRATGTLAFDGGATVHAALTRSQFLETPMGETQEVWVRSEPWCSWRVTRLKAEGRVFLAVLQFHSEHLKSVELVESGQVGLSPWSNWSEVDELNQETHYDAFLWTELGAERSFSWGSVSATYDAKSGSSSIHVRYR